MDTKFSVRAYLSDTVYGYRHCASAEEQQTVAAEYARQRTSHFRGKQRPYRRIELVTVTIDGGTTTTTAQTVYVLQGKFRDRRLVPVENAPTRVL